MGAFVLKDGRIIHAGATHVKLRGGFGWWIGVLRDGKVAVTDCGHQHEDRGVALKCSNGIVDGINGLVDKRFRREW